MALTQQDLYDIYNAVWFGLPEASLIPVRQSGKSNGWPEYVLGSATDWIVEQQMEPMRRKLDALTNLVAKQGNVSADEIATTLREGLVADVFPVLREVVGEALGDDEVDRADDISERVLDGLVHRLQGTSNH